MLVQKKVELKGEADVVVEITSKDVNDFLEIADPLSKLSAAHHLLANLSETDIAALHAYWKSNENLIKVSFFSKIEHLDSFRKQWTVFKE